MNPVGFNEVCMKIYKKKVFIKKKHKSLPFLYLYRHEKLIETHGEAKRHYSSLVYSRSYSGLDGTCFSICWGYRKCDTWMFCLSWLWSPPNWNWEIWLLLWKTPGSIEMKLNGSRFHCSQSTQGMLHLLIPWLFFFSLFLSH